MVDPLNPTDPLEPCDFHNFKAVKRAHESAEYGAMITPSNKDKEALKNDYRYFGGC
jgi:hypothetical protein